MIRISLKQEA